jgi:acetylornithine deacetylase/succinyl-diaminopimelate desuccinylase-like protein
VNNASQEIWHEDYIAFGEGGSIPFMEFLRNKWPKAQFIVSGVLGPDSNAHGPDEALDLPYLKDLMAAVSYIIYYSIPEFFPQVAPKFAKL